MVVAFLEIQSIGTLRAIAPLKNVPAKFSIECRGMFCMLHASGDLDSSNCGDLDAAISAAARSHRGAIVVSFARCTFADSTCLFVLTQQYARLGKRFLIVAPRGGRLRRVLDLAFLSTRLPVSTWPEYLLTSGIYRTAHRQCAPIAVS